MEVKTKRGEFLSTLYWTQGIVERRHTLPILANVLLECTGGNLRITGTDLEVGVRAKLPAQVIREGSVTVNAKKLYEIVREAPEEEIQLRRLDNDWVEIRSGKSVFKIVGIDAREFPQFPKVDGEKVATVAGEVLKEMIEKTIFSVSTDETRYALNGVLLEEGKGGKITMVATDGHRLSLVERGLGPLGLKRPVILPRKGLSELVKLLEATGEGMVSVAFKENIALIVRNSIELFMRLIEGEFPDYGKVIPRENPMVLRVEQRSLLQALRRVSILLSERYKGIRAEVREGRMVITASNPDLGEAVEELEIAYQGKPLTVGFNACYLLDVLGVLENGGEVVVRLKDEQSPGLIRKEGDEGYLHVVMPMRL